MNAILFQNIQPNKAFYRTSGGLPILSEAMNVGEDLITDVSFATRSLPAVGVSALDGTLGISSLLGLIYLDSADKAGRRAIAAQRVGYTEGEQSARFGVYRNCAQAGSAVMWGSLRGLTLASVIQGADISMASPSLIGRVTCVFSTIASVFSSVIYLLLAISCGREIHVANKFTRELTESCTITDNTDHAQLLRYVRFFEKWGMVGEQAEAQAAAGELRQMALDNATEILRNAGLQGDDARIHALIRGQITEKFPDENVDTVLEQLGKGWRREKLAAKRQLEVGGLTNASCADAMRRIGKDLRDNGELLSARIENGEEGAIAEAQALIADTQTLVEKMHAALDVNFKLNLGYLTACLLGITATILSFVALGPVGILGVTLLFLLIALMMTCLDGYRLHLALKNSTPGSFDSKAFALSSGLGLIAMGGGIALTSILSLGIAPLVGAITIGVIWMAINGNVWMKVQENQQDHVTLQEFGQLLYTENAARLRRLFKNLPKADRVAICYALDDTGAIKRRASFREGRARFRRHPDSLAVKQVVDRRLLKLEARAQESGEFLRTVQYLRAAQ